MTGMRLVLKRIKMRAVKVGKIAHPRALSRQAEWCSAHEFISGIIKNA